MHLAFLAKLKSHHLVIRWGMLGLSCLLALLCWFIWQNEQVDLSDDYSDDFTTALSDDFWQEEQKAAAKPTAPKAQKVAKTTVFTAKAWGLACARPSQWVSPMPGNRPTKRGQQQADYDICFVIHWAPIFVKMRERFPGMLPSVGLAQCRHESNFFSSSLGKSNQGFGIKWTGRGPRAAAKDDCGGVPCNFSKHDTRWLSLYEYAELINRVYNPAKSRTDDAAKLVWRLQFGRKNSGGGYRWISYATMHAKSWHTDAKEQSLKQQYVVALTKHINDNGWAMFDDMTYEQALAWSNYWKQQYGVK